MGFSLTTLGHVKEARANLDAGNVVASNWLWQRNSTVSQRYGCTDNPYEDSAPSGWCTNDPHGNRWHHGLDINDDINQPNPAVGCTAPYNTLPSGTGSPLYADGPGTVIAAGATSYGTIVEWQRDSDGYYVVLYHTQAITVHMNDRLFAGEQIAQVGNNGWPSYSTGCHLHFEIRAPPGGYWNDTDPTSYLSLSPTRFDLFAPDAVGNLWQKTWGPGSCWQYCWSAPSLGAPSSLVLASQPAATWSHGNTRIDVFAKASDGNIWQRYCQSGGSCWSSWGSIGSHPGGNTPDPAVAAWTSGDRFDLFVTDGGGGLEWKYLGSSGGCWQSCWSYLWNPPTTVLMSRPSAIWWNNNNWLDVFAQGSDGHLWQIYCHSGSSCTTGPNWSAWIDLGLYNASQAGPTVAGYVGNGVRLDIFIRGSDQNLYEKTWQAGSLWGNWRLAGATPGGVLGSDPTAAWWSSNQWLDVFVGGADGHVWQYYFRGSAWAWNDNGLWPGSASSTGRIAAGAPLR